MFFIMDTQPQVEKKWALASIPFQDAYTDFLVSRQAMMCTPRTIQFYEFTLKKISEWFESHNVHQPTEITRRQVRALLGRWLKKVTAILIFIFLQESSGPLQDSCSKKNISMNPLNLKCQNSVKNGCWFTEKRKFKR